MHNNTHLVRVSEQEVETDLVPRHPVEGVLASVEALRGQRTGETSWTHRRLGGADAYDHDATLGLARLQSANAHPDYSCESRHMVSSCVLPVLIPEREQDAARLSLRSLQLFPSPSTRRASVPTIPQPRFSQDSKLLPYALPLSLCPLNHSHKPQSRYSARILYTPARSLRLPHSTRGPSRPSLRQ